MYPLSSDDHPGHLYLQATQGFLRGAGCYGKSKLCSCVRTPKGPNTGGDMDDMGRFKQVGTEMSVDFAVDSAMINSRAATLMPVSSDNILLLADHSIRSFEKWRLQVAQHRQGTHICQRGPRLHTCEALKIGLECVKSLKSTLLPLLFFFAKP